MFFLLHFLVGLEHLLDIHSSPERQLLLIFSWHLTFVKDSIFHEDFGPNCRVIAADFAGRCSSLFLSIRKVTGELVAASNGRGMHKGRIKVAWRTSSLVFVDSQINLLLLNLMK